MRIKEGILLIILAAGKRAITISSSDGEVRRVSVVKVGSGVLWKAECRIGRDSLMADLTDLTLHDVLTTTAAVHISTAE